MEKGETKGNWEAYQLGRSWVQISGVEGLRAFTICPSRQKGKGIEDYLFAREKLDE